MITIAYMTFRKNPRFEWFVDSLLLQDKKVEFKVIVVDFLRDVRDLAEYARSRGLNAVSVAPKPSVWQGPHRLTKADYFAASNARNTAIALADDGYICFVDDLSVLSNLWLSEVAIHAKTGRVICGTYQKALNLVVKNGKIASMKHYPQGEDGRLMKWRGGDRGPCDPRWFFGCSCGAPVEALLKINGYPEICDGMGYEDSQTGLVLRNAGFHVWFSHRMGTTESEEGHHEDTPMLREDPGQSPNDKSHALVNMCRKLTRFDNYFGDEGLRGLRQRVRSGEPFPIMNHPTTEWFTGTPLKDLPHATN